MRNVAPQTHRSPSQHSINVITPISIYDHEFAENLPLQSHTHRPEVLFRMHTGYRIVYAGLVAEKVLVCSSPPLEEATAPGDGDRLVHDPFADAEVFVEPAADVLVVARDALGLEGQTG